MTVQIRRLRSQVPAIVQLQRNYFFFKISNFLGLLYSPEIAASKARTLKKTIQIEPFCFSYQPPFRVVLWQGRL